MQPSYTYWVKFNGAYYAPNTPIDDGIPSSEVEPQGGGETVMEPNIRQKNHIGSDGEQED